MSNWPGFCWPGIPMRRSPSPALPSERARAEDLANQVGSPRCFSMAGKTTLRQLLILFDLAEVLVTNDSGPAHFAALTSIDIVVLFGPETPKLFAAPSRAHAPALGRPGVQSLHQCLQQPQFSVSQQCLHAGHHRPAGVWRSLPALREPSATARPADLCLSRPSAAGREPVAL